MKRIISSLVLLLIAGSLVFAQEEKIVPTFEEVLSLRGSGGPVISHDGKHVLFTQTQLAAIWHNWQWFGKYIWGEEIEITKE